MPDSALDDYFFDDIVLDDQALAILDAEERKFDLIASQHPAQNPDVHPTAKRQRIESGWKPVGVHRNTQSWDDEDLPEVSVLKDGTYEFGTPRTVTSSALTNYPRPVVPVVPKPIANGLANARPSIASSWRNPPVVVGRQPMPRLPPPRPVHDRLSRASTPSQPRQPTQTFRSSQTEQFQPRGVQYTSTPLASESLVSAPELEAMRMQIEEVRCVQCSHSTSILVLTVVDMPHFSFVRTT
jgi:hypothetical protein